MAETAFDPSALGDVPVEQEFDPSSLGDVAVDNFDPASLGDTPVEETPIQGSNLSSVGLASASRGILQGVTGAIRTASTIYPQFRGLADTIAESTGIPTTEEFLTELEGAASRASDDYGVDPKQKGLLVDLASGAGSLLPTVASGPFAPFTTAAMMGEQGLQESREAGASPTQQATTFLGNAATGFVTEKLLGLPALLKSARAAKLPEKTLKALISSVTKQVGLSFVREGTQESLEQLSQDTIAKYIAAYDPDRKVFDGKKLLKTALVGGLLGGPVGGLVQLATDLESSKEQNQIEAEQVDQTIAQAAAIQPPPLPTNAQAIRSDAGQVPTAGAIPQKSPVQSSGDLQQPPPTEPSGTEVPQPKVPAKVDAATLGNTLAQTDIKAEQEGRRLTPEEREQRKTFAKALRSEVEEGDTIEIEEETIDKDGNKGTKIVRYKAYSEGGRLVAQEVDEKGRDVDGGRSFGLEEDTSIPFHNALLSSVERGVPLGRKFLGIKKRSAKGKSEARFVGTAIRTPTGVVTGESTGTAHPEMMTQALDEGAPFETMEENLGFAFKNPDGTTEWVDRVEAGRRLTESGQITGLKPGEKLTSEHIRNEVPGVTFNPEPVAGIPVTANQAAETLQPFFNEAVEVARKAGAKDPEAAASQAQIELSNQVEQGKTTLDNPKSLFLEAARRQAGKQKTPVAEPTEEPEAVTERGPRAEAISRETAKSIQEVVASMPENDRKVMEAMMEESRTDEQLSEDLGLTIDQVKKAKSRARESLKQFIQREGIGERMLPGAASKREFQRARYIAASDIYEGLRASKQLDRSTWEKNINRIYEDLFTQEQLDEAWAVSQEASQQFQDAKGRKPFSSIIDQLLGEQAGTGVTGIRNKQADIERRKRGLPAAMEAARRSHPFVWDEAMRQMDENPQLQEETVNKFRENPFDTPSDVENAILLHRQIDLENQYDRAVDEINSAFEKGDESKRLEAISKAKEAENKLIDIFDVNKQAGSAAGRSLSARRMMAGRDYTLARMVAETRASKGGEELTSKERADLEKQFAEIERTQKELKDRLEELENQDATKAGEETLKTLKNQTGKKIPKKDTEDNISKLTNKMKARIKEGDTVNDLRSYIQKLSLELVRGGVSSLNGLVDRVHEIVSPMVEGITKREVMDLISGYGDSKALDMEKAKVQLRDLKGQMQQTAKLEDIINKRPLLKTGTERRTPSDTERRLIREVNEAKKKHGVVTTDPEKQLKSALESVKTRIKNQIKDLAHQLDTGETPTPGTPPPTDAQVESLKATRDQLRQTLRDIEGKPEMSDAQRVKIAENALEKTIQEYERKIKTGDVSSERGPVSTPYSAKITALRARRDALRAELDALKAADQNLQDTKAFDRLMKSADELQAKLDRGDVSKETKAARIEDELVTKARERLQALRDQMQAARNATPEAQQAKLDAAIQSVQRSIESYDAKLKAGDTATATKGPKVTSPVLERLRAERDAMKKLVLELRKPPKLSPELLALKMLKARLERSNADIQERLARGDFSKKVRKEVDVSKDAEAVRLLAENEKWKREFENRKMENERSMESGLRKTLRIGKEILNVPRAIKSAFDFSAVLRQGGFLAFGNPGRAVTAMRDMFRSLGQKGFEKTQAELKLRPNYNQYKKSGLYLAELEGALDKREEAFRSELADRIPGVKLSNRTYIAFLNRLRADSFDALTSTLSTSPTPEQQKAIAHFINVSTGRGDLGAHGSAAETLSTVLWSPRLLISRIQLLTAEPLLRGNAAGVRKVIAKEYAKTIAGVSLVMALGALAGAEMEDDPRSSDFGKMKFGNTRIDPWMGLQQITVLASRLLTGKTKTQGGEMMSLRKTDDKKRPPWAETGYDVVARFLRTKLTPLLGTGLDLVSGENVVGEKVTLGNTALSLSAPLSFGDLLPILKEHGVPAGSALQLLNLFGMSVQNYQDKKEKKR